MNFNDQYYNEFRLNLRTGEKRRGCEIRQIFRIVKYGINDEIWEDICGEQPYNVNSIFETSYEHEAARNKKRFF